MSRALYLRERHHFEFNLGDAECNGQLEQSYRKTFLLPTGDVEVHTNLRNRYMTRTNRRGELT